MKMSNKLFYIHGKFVNNYDGEEEFVQKKRRVT